MDRKRADLTPSEHRDHRIDALARTLMKEGRHEEALEALSTLATIFNRHEPEGTLPCLCADCLPRDLEAPAQGERFVLDFVVFARRCFFYWVPPSLTHHRELERLRRSMRVSVQDRINQLLHARSQQDRSSPPEQLRELFQQWDSNDGNKEIPF